MHEIITNIISQLTVGGEHIPSAPLRFRGQAERFVTWQMTSDSPELSADDECIVSIVDLDVDVYSSAEYLDILDAVKTLFTSAGWVWSGTGPEMYEEDTGLYHRTISFSTERMN